MATIYVKDTYSIGGNEISSDTTTMDAYGVFVEAGLRVYLARNLNLTAVARYTSLESDDAFYDTTITHTGTQVVFGMGYAF
jgi:hypothetical protein